MARAQTRSLPFSRTWYCLSRAKDSPEKRLAFLDGILDYGFCGAEAPDPSQIDNPRGIDYARYDGFLAAKDAIDDILVTAPKKNPNMARWGNKNACKNQPQNEAELPPEMPPEEGENKNAKTQLRFDCENAKNAKKRNCVLRFTPSERGDSLFYNIYNNTLSRERVGGGAAFAALSPSCDSNCGEEATAEGAPETATFEVPAETDPDGGDLRRILPSQEEMILFAHQINVPDSYLPIFVENMKSQGWGYVNRGGAYVQLNRRNFKAILRSFYTQHKKDHDNGNSRTGNPKAIRATGYNEGLAAKKGF